jgi:hypothetical protein
MRRLFSTVVALSSAGVQHKTQSVLDLLLIYVYRIHHPACLSLRARRFGMVVHDWNLRIWSGVCPNRSAPAAEF